ncbi:MAG: Gfo/Idh/MocA family oxidoreductase [Victivallales bacterium]|jgi:predicted dehydrogenase|nr:Gfo/Idh/MocA family oxidoreductase [Victivallales bacterium]
MKIAFAGFRHAHIFSLYDRIVKNPEWELVAICEESPAESLLVDRPDIKLTHADFDQLLSEVNCEVIAIGDYYSKRGDMVYKALQTGKHVIADKPLCTSLAQLDEIADLAKTTGLKIGCMYEMRACKCFAILRELVAAGTLGEIKQIQFCGQHPLNIKQRPHWYFEAGKHGGTINDIAGHAIDIIPWITGVGFKRIVAARTWKSLVDQQSFMNDSAQFMLEMTNNCGVIGDVSYQGVDSFGFDLPAYWRFNFWGNKGMAECSRCGSSVTLYENGKNEPQILNHAFAESVDYLECFKRDIAGIPTDLDTSMVLAVNRFTLKIQEFADRQ